VPALDDHVSDYDVNEVHAIALDMRPETALARVLALPAGSDRIVRALFRLRGVRGGNLPIERFAREVLALEFAERTATRAVAVGHVRRIHIGISFEAEPQANGGSRLVTETRVAGGGFRFRLYWFAVAPFSGVIRRRWLRAVARSERS